MAFKPINSLKRINKIRLKLKLKLKMNNSIAKIKRMLIEFIILIVRSRKLIPIPVIKFRRQTL